MNAFTYIITQPEWELATGSTYVLTEDDVSNGRNKLGIDVRHIPLNVTLCGFCDGQVHADGLCHDCRVIHSDIADQWRSELSKPEGWVL